MLPLLLVLAQTSSLASSATTPPALDLARPVLVAHLDDYFALEKSQALVFFGSGLVSFGASALLLTRDDDTSRAAGVPTLAFGLVKSLVGIVLYARTDAQVAALHAQLVSDPLAFTAEEGRRMDGVLTSFTVVEVAEIVLTIAGGVLYAVGEAEAIPELRGVGLSVGAEALTLLGLDFIADQRAIRYRDAIRDFEATRR